MPQSYPYGSVVVKFLIASAGCSACCSAIGYVLSAQYRPLSVEEWASLLGLVALWGSGLGLVLGLLAVIFKIRIAQPSTYLYFFLGGFLVILPLLYLLFVGFGPTQSPSVYLRTIVLYGSCSGVIGLLSAVFALPRLPQSY